MEPAELIRIQRHVGRLLHPLLVKLTQDTKRPVDKQMLRALREFGLRCYLQGRAHAFSAPTVVPPPRDGGELAAVVPDDERSK